MIRTSRIPAGVIVEGQIRGQGDLVIAGLVEGSLDVDGLVVIEASGQVRGPVRARAIAVSGSVQGPLTADESIRLEPGARVVGDVVAGNVSAALGAMVRGRVRMLGAERLDRTEGGTVRAPWSSAGTLIASRTATGMIAAPKSSARVPPEAADTIVSGPRSRTTPAEIERPPQVIEASPPVEPPPSRRAEVERPHEDKPKRSRTVHAAPVVVAAPPVVAPPPPPVIAAPPPPTVIVEPPVRRAPPPPVMPSIGRVRARRKDGDRDPVA